MKNVKRISALLLCALFLCSAFLFAACGEEEGGQQTQSTAETTGKVTDDAASALYQVTVVDGFGNPYTEKVIVKFMQNENQIAMATVNENGVVEKELPVGEYAVEIATTESGKTCYYDTQAAVLNADTTKLSLVMAYHAAGETTSFTAICSSTNEDKEYQAYSIGVGCTYVTLDQEDRTYVLFAPEEGGVYRFSVKDNTAVIGYYGAPHFVQQNCLSEVTENTFEIPVSADSISSGQNGTARLVIGLDAEEGATGAIVNVERVGDTPWSVNDEPWSNYQPKTKIEPYTAPEGIQFTAFDLTAPTRAYKLVLNSTDGYYHLNSETGPVVYVQLANESYGISMKNMVGEIIYVDGVLMQSGSTSFRYMYDNGPEDFFKEDYTDAMRQYVTNRDQSTGVYPMTEDLYYILTMGTKFIGWCDPENANYRFAELPGVNHDLSWLFLCVYESVAELPPVETEPVQDTTDSTTPTTDANTGNSDNSGGNAGSNTGNDVNNNSGSSGNVSGTVDNNNQNTGSDNVSSKPIEDNKSEPIEIGGTLEFDASVRANHIVYYSLYRVTDTTLTIRSNDAYVIYNRKTYQPVNGVVTVPNLYSSSTNVPVKIAIGNQGTVDAVFSVKMTYTEGHRMNPYVLTTGNVSTFSASGNSQGVYYTFTANKDGILTVTLNSVSGGANGNISITSGQISGGTNAVDLRENANADGKSVSFAIKSGETVIVQIGVLPDDGFSYPEATIQTTVDFR